MLPDLAKVQLLQEAHWPPASPARLAAWSRGQGHLPTRQLAPAPGSARVGTQSPGGLTARWGDAAVRAQGRAEVKRAEAIMTTVLTLGEAQPSAHGPHQA